MSVYKYKLSGEEIKSIAVDNSFFNPVFYCKEENFRSVEYILHDHKNKHKYSFICLRGHRA